MRQNGKRVGTANEGVRPNQLVLSNISHPQTINKKRKKNLIEDTEGRNKPGSVLLSSQSAAGTGAKYDPLNETISRFKADRATEPTANSTHTSNIYNTSLGVGAEKK